MRETAAVIVLLTTQEMWFQNARSRHHTAGEGNPETGAQ
jgi:hypothetical protein